MRAGIVVASAFIGMAVLVGSASTTAVNAGEKSLVGVYTCVGTNPNGVPYAGLAEIRATGDTYHARWTFPKSGFRPVGVGFVHNGKLVIGYQSGTAIVVAVYDINGKTLKGRWTAFGSGTVWSETLERKPAVVTVPDPAPDPAPHQHDEPDEPDEREIA